MPHPLDKKTTKFHQNFLEVSERKKMRLVKSVESADQKVGLDYVRTPRNCFFIVR